MPVSPAQPPSGWRPDKFVALVPSTGITPSSYVGAYLLDSTGRPAYLGAAGQRTIAFFGDSISTGYSGTTTLNKISFCSVVLQLSKQRFSWPQANDFGVSGNTTTQMLARVDDVLAARPDICIVHGGTNDINGGTISPTTTISNLDAIYDALIAAGITVIAIPILGRTTPALTSTKRNYGQQINDWIRRNQETRKGLIVVDCGLAFDDPTSTTWAERSGYTADGLHPNQLGAYYIAKKVVAALDVLFPSFNIPVTSPADAYHSTENPYGNRLETGTGMFGGTSGSISTGDASGTVATGWTLTSSNLGGATCVASKVTLADGRNAQRITLSGNYTGNDRWALLSCGATAGNFAAGDTVETMVEAFVAAGNASIEAIVLRQYITDGGQNYFYQDGMPWATGALPTEAYNPIFRTPPRTLGAIPTNVLIYIYIQFVDVAAVSTAIAAEIDFCSACIRTVRP